MLVRTRPFHPVLDQPVDRVFDQLARSFFAPARQAFNAAWTDGTLVLTVDLPGTPADTVEVSVAGRTLTVRAEQWERSVRLGSGLDPEQVSARYLDGRLTVTVAPVAAVEPRRIDVSTEVVVPTETEESAPQPENGTSDNG